MNQLQAMRVFIRVVDLGGFNLTAKQLGMSGAAVTRNIGMLEAHLGMRLLNRSTRSLSLTEAGQLYLEGCRAVVEKLDEVESDLIRATRAPIGVLRIAAPAVFAGGDLAGLFREYRERNPRVDFAVTVYDAPINLIEGGYDICFATSRHPANASLVSRSLTSEQEIAVASPAYLVAHGQPQKPSDLSAHELISLADGPRIWEFGFDRNIQRITVNGPLTTSNYAMARAAALADMGIALLPAKLVEQDVESGALRRVLERHDVNGGRLQISIVYPGRNYLTMKVRSFIDFAVDYFRTDTAQASNGLRSAA
ncbi:MAG: LysR family transcriptional regulator [Paraburkholderia sp.]|uniref:LysR family transcriptional regulator n=1 Tax=Paraburkholderia sp. TaxID=1926495 RepID=UPI00121A1069|nr:LysR family transcriptional regulator [Paraburkholderia sp.]TAM08351.1 MAG: LysR family transcriptional regulator [Paraburkholderia sp.]TAM29929.1 MAG: LysR family transcriptional regulator [Paraburkholderia sp.]